MMFSWMRMSKVGAMVDKVPPDACDWVLSLERHMDDVYSVQVCTR